MSSEEGEEKATIFSKDQNIQELEESQHMTTHVASNNTSMTF
jgi:hypothetical protein